MAKKNYPLVSIIIPSYNCGKYLYDAYESVIYQTYENIEILIVDDNSKEKESLQILKQLENFEKVKVYYLKKNYGVAYVRNFAIKNSTGKYILPLDCDDKIHKTYIEKAIGILEKDQNIKLVYSDAILFGEVEDVWKLPDFDLKKLLIKNYIHNSALFRKDDFLKTKGYDANLEGLEDWDLWISLFEANNGYGYHIPETLFYYRIRKKSRQQLLNQNPEKLEKIRKQIVYKHLKFYSDILGNPRDLYLENIRLRQKLARIENSFRFKLISFIFKPYDWIKRKCK